MGGVRGASGTHARAERGRVLGSSRGQATGGLSATGGLRVPLKGDGVPPSGLGLGVMGSGSYFEKVSACRVGNGLEEG